MLKSFSRTLRQALVLTVRGSLIKKLKLTKRLRRHSSQSIKAKKTRLQLAAYKLAAETLGIRINKTQIIVSTPVEQYQTQVLHLGDRGHKDEENWLALVDKYYTEVFPKHC